ncbi:MAG: tRNA (adenosine(37)-N6)-threonylcarbamoyltransferase complex ATPase subunit type 1 TsaE [Qingshengfaniella sp.]
MSAETRLVLTTDDPTQTAALARRLAPVLRAGDVLALTGPIGAGKSLMAREIIRTRGVTEDIPSPTFTLVQSYVTPDLEIWHTDLYRLSGAGEVWELGLEDAFDTALCLVEWPDRLGGDLPATALHLSLDPLGETGGQRRIILSGPAPVWADRLAALRTEPADD